MNRIGCCGIPCSACFAGTGRIAKMAEEFRGLIGAYSYDWIAEAYGMDFQSFKGILDWFAEESTCPTCKEGGGAPCEYRPCARERGLETCFECQDFPCERLEALISKYPFLLESREEYVRMGRAAWLEKLDKESEEGFHICRHLLPQGSSE